jgi:hypothetical protein
MLVTNLDCSTDANARPWVYVASLETGAQLGWVIHRLLRRKEWQGDNELAAGTPEHFPRSMPREGGIGIDAVPYELSSEGDSFRASSVRRGVNRSLTRVSQFVPSR